MKRIDLLGTGFCNRYDASLRRIPFIGSYIVELLQVFVGTNAHERIKKNISKLLLLMLLQLENTDHENIERLLMFAKQNNLELSLIDDAENRTYLPGKPLNPFQLTQLIENSRKSGTIRMEDAHSIIRYQDQL